ncbi:MAG: hypothetical protein P4L53_26680 [Candidatus Obscuribacterales bacterium]|nr:hypothetical protein [Candidatus Obscuribacterales bacterium]
MQHTTKRNLAILLTATSISLVSILAARSDLPKDSPAQTSVDGISDTGETGVVLKRLSDGKTNIQVSSHLDQKLRNELYFSGDSFVIKIGDTYTRGKSIEELNKLLRGPVNSKIDVVFLEGDQVKSKSLTRLSGTQTINKQSYTNGLLNLNSLFTSVRDTSQEACRSGESWHAEGNNLAAAPYFIVAVHPPEFMSLRLFDDEKKSLPAALKFFARSGLFNEFDSAAKSLSDFAKKNDTDFNNDNCELFTKGADVLARNGHLDDASAITEKLFLKTSSLSPENKISVLQTRAFIQTKKGEKEAALQSYNDLAKLCSELPPQATDQKLEVLGEIVSYFSQTEHLDLAESAQSQLVATVNPFGPNRLFNYQRKVDALLKLSDIYKSLGNYDKESKLLQQCLDLYNENLNAQEKVILERIGSLCPSIITTRIAESYYREGSTDKASAEITKALKITTDAIGADSSISSQLATMQKLLTATNEKAESERIIAAFKNLDTLTSTQSLENNSAQELDAKQARECYDDKTKHSDKSNAKLESIISRELAKTEHTADDITRIINLIRLTETSNNKKRSIGLLERLNPCFEKSELKYSTTQLFQKIELAMLTGAKVDAIKSEPLWQSFDAFIKQIQTPSYGTPRQLAMGISYAYAFLKEPEKSLAVLEYAQLQQAAPVAAYKALLYLLEDNDSAAQSQIAALRSSTQRIDSEVIKMMVLLSNTYFHRGNTKLASEILQPDFIPSNSTADSTLTRMRIVLQYQQGKYQDALNALKGEDTSFSFGNAPVNMSLLKAVLFEKTDQPNEAILALLKCQAPPELRPMLLHQAVLQARKMKSFPPETVKALVEATRFYNAAQSAEHLKDMEYINSIASANKTSDSEKTNLEYQIATTKASLEPLSYRLLGAINRAKKLENDGDQSAPSEWANVARLYFAEKNYDEGTSAMVHALQMKNGAAFNHGMYHPGNFRGDSGFTILVDAKKYDDAEKILKQAIIAPGKIGVTQSSFIEKALLAELYIEEGKFDEATKWAKEVILNLELSCDPNMKKTYVYLMDGYMFFTLVDKFIEHKQFDTAQKLIDYATKIQLSVYGPKHPLFIENYQSQTKLFLAQTKLTEAEASARKALTTEKYNGGSGNTGKASAKLLASVLRLEGRNDEADKVSTSNAQRPNLKDLSRQIYSGHSFHGEEPSGFLKTAEDPLKERLANALEYDGEGTSAYAEALSGLTRFYMEAARYDDAEKQQLHQLQILNDKYGNCSKPKFVCYLYLAEIYLKKNEKAQATKYALLIEKPLPSEHSQDDPKLELRYANVLFEIGKRTEAIAIAKKLEADLLASRGNRGLYRAGVPIDDLMHFMERAGLSEDVKTLTEIKNPPTREQLLPPRIKTPPPPMAPKTKEPTEAELLQSLLELSKKKTDSKALLKIQFELLNARIDAGKFTELSPDLQKIQKNILAMKEIDRQIPVVNLLDVATILVKARHTEEAQTVLASAFKILDTFKSVVPQITDELLKLSEVLADQSNFVLGKEVFARYCSAAPLAGINNNTIDYQQMEHKSLMPPETPESKYKKLLAKVEQAKPGESPVLLEEMARLLIMELQQKKPDAKKLVPRLAEGLKESKLTKLEWPLGDLLKSDIELLYKSNQTAEARILVSATLEIYARDFHSNPAPTDGLLNPWTLDHNEIRRAREEYLKLIETHKVQDPKSLLMMYAEQLNYDIRNKNFSTTPTYIEKITQIVKNAPNSNLEDPLDNFGYAGTEYEHLKMIAEAEKIFQTEIELDVIATSAQPKKRHTKALRRLAIHYQKDNWEKSKQLMLDAVNIGVETLPPIKKYLGPDIKLVVQKYLDLHDLNGCEETISQIDTLTPDWPEAAIRSDYRTEQKLSYDFEKFQSWERAAYWINKVVEINTQQKDVGTAVMNLKRCATDLEKAGHPDKASQCIQQAKKLEDDFKKAHGGRW